MLDKYSYILMTFEYPEWLPFVLAIVMTIIFALLLWWNFFGNKALGDKE